jgi:cobyrinic acid a,c-diamide synthase
MKGCVISAPMTGSGKTTVTLGLLAALRKRGVAVQPFKIGPDFIDPGLHEIASGVPSHNLDSWMLTRDANESLFACASVGRKVAVVEGVMGLFDGFDGKSDRGSTAEMAVWLDLPVFLVVDAHGMARSAAALTKGFRLFDPRLKLAGVIFNRIGGEGHFRILADAVTDVPILGWLPVQPSIEIPERHLGLFTGKEDIVVERIRAIGEFVEKHVLVDEILGSIPSPSGRGRSGSQAKREPDRAKPQAMADAPGEGDRFAQILRPSPFLEASPSQARASRPLPEGEGKSNKTHRVALAHDKAFSFYYHANRLALLNAGAEIIEFSPINDKEVPDADLLYIGGGYPEIYRNQLEANTSMRTSIRRFIESGKKFYAECGGLMYLAESIDGAQMVGIIPARVEMTDRLVDFGYCEVRTNSESILGPAGTTARGHQFHYSRAVGLTGSFYRVQQGLRAYTEGFTFPNGVASYIHLHFLSNPALARNMLNS